jgi:hypothetical protein
MRAKTELMQPLHVVIPGDIRAKMVSAARSEGVSLAEIARDLLVAGIEARRM